MNKTFFSMLASLLCIIAAGLPASAEKETARFPGLSTGLEDQTGIAITIYNVNLGLVKDTRQLKIQKGSSELRFMDVASQIIPTSVHIKSLVNSASLVVLEQNYEYDLLNPQRLLDKYVAKR